MPTAYRRAARAAPRPAQLKATLGYRDGWIGEVRSPAGPGARERGGLALAVLEHRLRAIGLAAHEQRAELIGVDAMHGPLHGAGRARGAAAPGGALRDAAQTDRVGQEVEALYLNGPGRRRSHAVGAR